MFPSSFYTHSRLTFVSLLLMIFVLFFPSVSQAAPQGSVQGYKVLDGEGDAALVQQSTVTLDDKLTTTTNPFKFANISARDYKVTVAVPPGYIVGYTLCRNRIDCHNQKPKPGNSVDVSVPKDGFVDLWWHFKRDLPVLSGYTRTAPIIDRFNAWDYAPSAIVLPDNPQRAQLFWCSADKNLQGKTSDSIFSVGYDIAARKVIGDPVKVLAPSMSGWDSYHTCDPSVVAGKFVLNGVNYSYALYYTATSRSGVENHIGVAFSNDLLQWTKYENYVIRPESLSGRTYGAGQSSVVNRDGTVFLFYIDRSRGVQKVLFRTTKDGVHFSDPQSVSAKGLENLSIDAPVFAYDSELKKWFLTVGVFSGSRPCGASPGRFPNTSVHTFVADDFATGEWKEIGAIDSGPHNLIMDHNPGFLTDIYGDISRFHSSLPTFYGHGFCFDIDSWSLQMSEGSFDWSVPAEEIKKENIQQARVEIDIAKEARAAETMHEDLESTGAACSYQEVLAAVPLYSLNILNMFEFILRATSFILICQ